MLAGGTLRHAASFRDPAGFVFEQDGALRRAVHPDAAADVEHLYQSGLHDELVAAGLLVAHRRMDTETSQLDPGWLLLEPQRLPIISYASEWTDTQLTAAAKLTLEIQRRALKFGMSLKDATAFNIQFVGARPVFIDLLSFARLGASRAWTAYKQFCEHFLAPLALRKWCPGALASTTRLDGLPLALTSRLLPRSTWFSPALLLHLHLHARATEQALGKPRMAATSARSGAIVEFQSRLIDSLAGAVQAVAPTSRTSSWSNYRQTNVYSAASAATKMAFVNKAAQDTGARRALDLGANDGHYARALVDRGVACTAVDVDMACCEAIYAASVSTPYDTLLNTLCVDLTNPTPSHGWAHRERSSFAQRLRCDLTLSLALVHHLSITHQVPFRDIAAFLAELAPNAIVEFVPPDDPMARQLLAARDDGASSFVQTLSQASFERAFAPWFDCKARSEALECGRFLYHFELRQDLG